LDKRVAILALAVTLLVKLAISFLPDGFVQAAFCLPPAHAAAFYYGVPLDVETLRYTAHGVCTEVTRACAATDFFSLVCGLLAAKAFCMRGGRKDLLVAAVAGIIPAAYIVTIAANSLRLMALVPIDAVFPRSAVPVIHLCGGAVVFLGVFLLLYLALRFSPRAPTGECK